MRIAFLFAAAVFAIAQDLSSLDSLKEAARLKPAEIARMENLLLSNPHDLSTRARLMTQYYQASLSHPRMPHVLWLIENHPESKLAGSPIASAIRTDLQNTRSDYEAARLLWLKQVDRHSGNPAVLTNAGRFFAGEEPKRAAVLLSKAWELDSENKARLSELARFYAQAISECEQSNCPDRGWVHELQIRLNGAESSTPVAREVRRLLASR